MSGETGCGAQVWPAVPGRRGVLGLGGAGAAWLLAGGPAWAGAVPPDGRISFDLIREGDKIGWETVTFQRSGSKLVASVEISIRVKIMMITVYRLHHHETETWDGGRLLSFAATTLRNGSTLYAQGWRVNDDLMVRGSAHPKGYTAPPGALPTSQWNHAMLRGPMINTQDARLMHPVVTDLGMAEIATADGGKIAARHFSARGDLQFDTFFSTGWEWVGLSFRADDGSLVSYERV